MSTLPSLAEITERLHQRIHQGSCADMNPVEHQRHMRAFALRARQIVTRGEWA
jgi:hypothetical protein